MQYIFPKTQVHDYERLMNSKNSQDKALMAGMKQTYSEKQIILRLVEINLEANQFDGYNDIIRQTRNLNVKIKTSLYHTRPLLGKLLKQQK